MAVPAISEPTPAILAQRGKIVAAIKRLIGPEHVISDDVGMRVFDADAWTGARGLPLAVVLPGSTEEISALLAFCDGEGVKVVPRGAGTSLCGAALPLADAIVLGLARMSRVLDIDTDNRTARVEAGLTTEALCEALAGAGFRFAPNPWSRSVCTIAGNIAMDAGGANALKNGTTTNHLLGVTMVLADGEVIPIGGAALEAPGYDLLALICGSEGQLGIVTEATVRIVAQLPTSRALLLAFTAFDAAVACATAINASAVTPIAMELMDRPAVHLCSGFAKAGYPLDVNALLIVECEGDEDEVTAALDAVEALAVMHRPRITNRAANEASTATVWKGWQAAYGAMAQRGGYYCIDGTVPLGALEFVLEKIDGLVRDRGLRSANIFRAGDGTLRSFILFDAGDPAQVERADFCRGGILELCVQAGGSISGEIGIGIEKRDLMVVQFNAFDLAQQMRVKSVFDPKWLLNPAKVFPLRRRSRADGS